MLNTCCDSRYTATRHLRTISNYVHNMWVKKFHMCFWVFCQCFTSIIDLVLFLTIYNVLQASMTLFACLTYNIQTWRSGVSIELYLDYETNVSVAISSRLNNNIMQHYINDTLLFNDGAKRRSISVMCSQYIQWHSV